MLKRFETSRCLNIYTDFLLDFLKGIRHFSFLGDPSSWVEIRIHQFPLYSFSQTQYSMPAKNNQ